MDKLIKVGNEDYIAVLPEEAGEDIKVYGTYSDGNDIDINKDYEIIFTDELKVKKINCEYDQPTAYELVAITKELDKIV